MQEEGSWLRKLRSALEICRRAGNPSENPVTGVGVPAHQTHKVDGKLSVAVREGLSSRARGGKETLSVLDGTSPLERVRGEPSSRDRLIHFVCEVPGEVT